MEKKTLSQEGLKLIACAAMLLDHIGMTLLPWPWLRIVGRIAFPIYCFLLAEGVRHTRSSLCYGIRLAIAAVLSEFPFDFLLYGRMTMAVQSVMVTLLLGFLALELAGKTDCVFCKFLIAAPFVAAAELLHTDYGAQGVLMILLFGFSVKYEVNLWKTALALMILGLAFPSWPVTFFGITLPIEIFCVFSVIPIALYRGRKASRSKVIQWSFYLFYPVHLLILGILFRWRLI